MNRREFLSRSGVVLGATALSGCTKQRLVEAEREPPPLDDVDIEEFDLPVTQRLQVAEAAIERAAGEEFDDLDAFERYLADADIDVEDIAEEVEAGETLVSLESVFEQSAERGFMDHLGAVAGGYAALVAGGHESEKLAVTLFDSDSREFGEYEIRRDWAVAFNEGELTARGYANEIATTAESV